MRLTLSVVSAVAVVACSDSFTPTAENVSGDYSLQTLTTKDLGPAKDWVAAGATLTITLAPNGTTTGHLFIPGADTAGTDFNADMAGTWTLTGDTVRFTQTADSFIRDMVFFARENRLVGDHAFGASGVSVSVVLTK